MKKVKYYIVLENIVIGGRSMEKERELIEESVSKEIDLSKEVFLLHLLTFGYKPGLIMLPLFYIL